MIPDHMEKAEQIVRELHGIQGFEAWAEHIAKALAAERAAALALQWRPIESAPKDKTPVLLKLKNPIPEPDREDLRSYDGLYFVGACIGDCWQWYFAAPVGHGGFPDDWFEGWMPLTG